MGQRPNSHRWAANDDRRQPDRDAAPAAEGRAARPARRLALPLAICVLLSLAVGLVFVQTLAHGFVNLDDNKYVYENPWTAEGLSLHSIRGAFTHVYASNWIPLTWISLMADHQFYGLHAGGYHLSNMLLHAATAMLLFLVLWRMTGRLWPSALVAALFAIHPLRAESVAWVTERKDVLSGLFFMLTLAAYVNYVHRGPSLGRYLAVMAPFALGLLCKAMLVTLPALLLLLDYWPLGRLTGSSHRQTSPQPLAGRPTKRAAHAKAGTPGRAAGSPQTALDRIPLAWRLVIEKLPLLFLVVLSSTITLSIQGQALASSEVIPWGWRISSALISYVIYLRQLFLPIGLAALYPPGVLHFPIWKVLGSALILIAVTAVVFLRRRQQPYLLVGWLWYLGMLLPVIGLVHVGLTARADRFTYLPEIGLCLALVWAAADACRSARVRRRAGWAALLALPVLLAGGWRQASFWHDSETLWNHTLACTTGNSVAHNSLGVALVMQGRLDEALEHYRAALAIDPQDVDPYCNIAGILATKGRLEEAVASYRKALENEPDHVKARSDLGDLLVQLGRLDEAAACYEKALEYQSDDALVHRNLGDLLRRLGRYDEAIAHFQKAIEFTPGDADAHINLGLGYQAEGKTELAMNQFRQALAIQPNLAEAHYNVAVALANEGRFSEAFRHCREAVKIRPDKLAFPQRLAWLLATCPEASLRNGAEAIELAERVNQFCQGKRIDALDTLAAAYAEGGRFADAVATVRRALEIARQRDDRASIEVMQSRLALYEKGQPFRQLPAAAAKSSPKP
jgi:tetratricopeptide (TPR) repeat protein